MVLLKIGGFYFLRLLTDPAVDSDGCEFVIVDIVAASVNSVESHFAVDSAVSLGGELGVEIGSAQFVATHHLTHSGRRRQTHLAQTHPDPVYNYNS